MASQKVVGCLGGGQLGRMLAESANNRNIPIVFLDSPNAPAKQITANSAQEHVDGSFKDAKAIEKLASKVDILTVEIEHVDTEILERLESEGKVKVEPSWRTLRVVQDKYAQKEHLRDAGVGVVEGIALEKGTVEELWQAVARLGGFPVMLKSRREAYDGRGNFKIKSEKDFGPALEALGGKGKGGVLYVERWAQFRMELAVMVVKTKDGVLAYPTTETIHTSESICKLTYTPARGISAKLAEQAQELAKKAVQSLWGKGLFGVEMFLLQDGLLLVNEIAPRPHNSGHYTIEACAMSQYAAHLSAILDLHVPQRKLRLREPAIMLNILGGETKDSHLKVAAKADQLFGAEGLHLYGKGDARKGRKMGHVTITAPTMEDAEREIQPLIDFIDNINQESGTTSSEPATNSSAAEAKPLVALVMGSDSDLPHLLPGIALLETLGIPYTTRVTSAHRTPEAMAEYAQSAEAEGIEVLIAAAGGAAHLPGMAASHTLLPVIGVPIKPRLGDGFDSIVSMTNMPAGVPVATVGLNNSVNAALLAARQLARKDEGVRERLRAWIENNKKTVLKKDAKLHEMGAMKYAEDVLGVKK
ncbi:hypothetical protein B0A48_05565 [Cryoendolithus antarcticus]|uniref:Phosphoribosylaminoimidazole carboxylase n=1 Tax=Cryoendolithus antarcticus TaxID=1507870 RepID=A0A1V8TIV9_9PEZI|nr:hypothetical protein B0A48_05565 [Cryoendolithus antarcticus]